MSSRLLALTLDGHDPARLAAFWAGVLVGPGQRQVRNNRVAPAVDLISLMASFWVLRRATEETTCS